MKSDEVPTSVFVHADTKIDISKHVTYYFGTHRHLTSTQHLYSVYHLTLPCLNVHYQSSKLTTGCLAIQKSNPSRTYWHSHHNMSSESSSESTLSVTSTDMYKTFNHIVMGYSCTHRLLCGVVGLASCCGRIDMCKVCLHSNSTQTSLMRDSVVLNTFYRVVSYAGSCFGTFKLCIFLYDFESPTGTLYLHKIFLTLNTPLSPHLDGEEKQVGRLQS